MKGLLPETSEQRVPQQVRLGGYVLNVTYERAATNAPVSAPGGATTVPAAGGLLIAVGPDECVLSGILSGGFSVAVSNGD